MTWWVYIVRCADWSLYTGITTEIERRIREHNTTKKGAAYTRSRRPVELFYTEGPYLKQDALKRERKIKALKRIEKEALILQCPITCAQNG